MPDSFFKINLRFNLKAQATDFFANPEIYIGCCSDQNCLFSEWGCNKRSGRGSALFGLFVRRLYISLLEVSTLRHDLLIYIFFVLLIAVYP